MIGLIKLSKRRRRVHATRSAGDGPMCGGGRQGRSAQWQMTLEPCNCAACLTILKATAAKEGEMAA